MDMSGIPTVALLVKVTSVMLADWQALLSKTLFFVNSFPYRKEKKRDS